MSPVGLGLVVLLWGAVWFGQAGELWRVEFCYVKDSFCMAGVASYGKARRGKASHGTVWQEWRVVDGKLS